MLLKMFGNEANYFCERKGMVVVRKNIFGKAKEIITGFFFANIKNYNPIDVMIHSYLNGYFLYDVYSGSLEKNIQRDGFALSIRKDTFTDINLATLEDIEEWEKDFKNSEFYKCYEQRHIISQEEQRKIRQKVNSLKF